MTIRSMCAADLPAIAAIQAANPEASQWPPADYLPRESYVAEEAGEVVGFLVLLPLTPDEAEILNLAVAPDRKRRGTGRALVSAAFAAQRTLHLDVRESNSAARAFYRNLGFDERGRRRDYYRFPPEDAILMTRPSRHDHK